MSDEFDYDLEPEDSRGISPHTHKEKKKVRGTPFVKGQSGNPNGKPKVHNLRDVRAMAREYTELALETLVEVCANPDEKGSARVAAANAIIDRGWGKAPQTVVVEGEVDVTNLDKAGLDQLTMREVAKFIAPALAAAEREAGESKTIN